MSELRFLQELESEFERIAQEWPTAVRPLKRGYRLRSAARNGLGLMAIAIPVVVVVAVAIVFLNVGTSQHAAGLRHGRVVGPAGGPIPKGFRVGSVTAINARTWWVLGPAVGRCRRSGAVTFGQPICAAILRTTDGGHHFVNVPAPPVLYLYEQAGPLPSVAYIHFANARDGYAYDNSLFVTHDGGATWHRPRLPALQIMEVTSAQGEVYALAQRGDGEPVVLRSPVGADKWTAVPETRYVTGISAYGRNLYATAIQGSRFYILASHDAGASVVRHYIAPWGDVHCTRIQAVSDADFWALCAGGMQSSLMWSPDGGRTLGSAGSGISLLNSAVFAARSQSSLVVGSFSLYRTDNGGDTFSAIPTPRAPRYGPNHTLEWTYLAFTDPGHGLGLALPNLQLPTAAQIPTYLFKTTDGGRTYQLVHIP